MTALAQSLMLSSGLARLGIAFAAGAIAALSLPPLFFLPALFVGVTALVWLLDGAERIRTIGGRLFGPAFRIGWMFGSGYLLVGLHWVGFAFLIEPELTGWVMPLALLALAFGLGLFFAFGTALAHWLWADGGQRIVALAVGLTLTEWLRGHILTGFPFDLPGYALGLSDELLQSASLAGAYGLTFVALLVAATLALIWPAEGEPLARRLVPLSAGLALLAVMLGFGLWRLASTEVTEIAGVKLRLVQPAIAQTDKWRPELADAIFQSLLDLSTAPASPGDPGLVAVTHLIWPESVFPFVVADHPDALARIARLLPPNTLLIAGAAREDHSSNPAPDGSLPVFNSILAINDVGEIVASYDKLRLVPFGEFVPFDFLFRSFGFSELVGAQSSFIPGAGTPRPFEPYATPPVLPLICYEAIFAGDLGPAAKDAQWMLNLTNDAWFADSIGPAQHFHHARMRAVEEGLSMVRLANTGVSALIDPLGRIVAKLPTDAPGVLDGTLSAPVNRTFFARYRSLPLAISLAVAFALVLLRNFAERRERPTV
ncbi:MAG: apolipoprotein N-acyltransferase [Cucumibacter sp.]